MYRLDQALIQRFWGEIFQAPSGFWQFSVLLLQDCGFHLFAGCLPSALEAVHIPRPNACSIFKCRNGTLKPSHTWNLPDSHYLMEKTLCFFYMAQVIGLGLPRYSILGHSLVPLLMCEKSFYHISNIIMGETLGSRDHGGHQNSVCNSLEKQGQDSVCMQINREVP